MKVEKVCSAYYSATYSTRCIVNAIAGHFGEVCMEVDLTGPGVVHGAGHEAPGLLVAGVPVYGGRVPAGAAERLKAIKGDGTPAVIVCVYGNRAYDDAMTELYDIVTANGFTVIAAAAVVAEHCIFPQVASGRPDAADWQKIDAFCADILDVIGSCGGTVQVKGNRPYKKYGGVPIHPSAGKECDKCGICAANCPAGAIPAGNPAHTDASKCIACSRCIKVCPRNARRFKGLLYKMARLKFVKDNSARKEPEFIVAR